MADRESERDGEREGERDDKSSTSSTSSSTSSTTSSSSSSASSTFEEAALEAWLVSDTAATLPPVWVPPRALGCVQRGDISPLSFRREARGSRSFVRRLQLQHKLYHHRGCVNSVNFDPSGRLLASTGDDLSVVIWNWVNKLNTTSFETGHRSNVFQARFMPQAGHMTLVTCARDGQVRVGHMTSTTWATRRLAQHRGAAHKLALDEDSPCVFLSAGEDSVVYSIDLRSDKPASKILCCRESTQKVPLYSVHCRPFVSHEIAVGGKDSFVRLFDRRNINESVNNGVLRKFCPSHLAGERESNVTCVVYNYNGTELLASYNDDDVFLFDRCGNGAEPTHRYKGHRNNATVKGVSFLGPRSEFVVSGSDCGHIFIWDKESNSVVQCLDGDHAGVVNCLEPHPHTVAMATSGLDHDVKIWSPTATEETDLEGLPRIMKQNKRERDDEGRTQGSEFLDSHVLWFLMHNLRHRARAQRWREREGEHEGESGRDSSDDQDDQDDQDDDVSNERVQCVPS